VTQGKRRAIAITFRFLNAVDAAREAAADAYAMDSQFDAGEFSGPAIERQFERDCDTIARRLGFVNAEVAYAVYEQVTR